MRSLLTLALWAALGLMLVDAGLQASNRPTAQPATGTVTVQDGGDGFPQGKPK